MDAKAESISNKLEFEYKENLKLIRPFVLSLTDHKALISCRIWIEKLDNENLNNDMKRIRNDYMTELRRQLHNRKLELPFTNEPPSGHLEDLTSRINSMANLVSIFDSINKKLNVYIFLFISNGFEFRTCL